MSSLYVHLPFCTRKCSYCGFYSISSLSLKTPFINALLTEIKNTTNYLPQRHLKTLYFGGGTPSLFTVIELDAILNKIAKYYSFEKDIEVTIEVNPERLTLEYLKMLKKLGINRLSIGIQSFNDAILHFLHRQHSAKSAENAIKNALLADFENISIDLIYGITERSEEMWKDDLKMAFSYPIQHFSAYALTVEENTLLKKRIEKGLVDEVDDTYAVRDFYILLEMSEKEGFEQYEISNFAKSNFISKHNFSYWQQMPYLGVGPSAHSYNLSSRKWNIANVAQYITLIENNEPFYEEEVLTVEEHYNEYILLRLRTNEGVDLELLEKQFGAEKKEWVLEKIEAIDAENYTFNNNIIRLTNRGKLWADDIAMTLFAE